MSGDYQCDRESNHQGEHECVAPEYTTKRTIEARVAVLEEQVASIQMSMPRGVPR